MIVVHHTDCGMLTFKTGDLQETLKQRLDNKDAAAVDAIAFLEIKDVKQSVAEDVAFLHNHALILKDIPISGYVYAVSGLQAQARAMVILTVP